MIGLFIFFAALILFAIASVKYGVDSREESTDGRRSPYPVGIN